MFDHVKASEIVDAICHLDLVGINICDFGEHGGIIADNSGVVHE